MDQILQWLKIWWRRLNRFLLVTTRTAEVAILFSPLILLTPTAVVIATVFQSPTGSDLAWGYAIRAIQSLGPVSIKFFQWAATRRDIFPPTLCDRLAILHDRGYPHSFSWTHQVLTDAFGDYQSKGLIIDDVIGCGSAAQVYRGKLKTTTATTAATTATDNANTTYEDDNGMSMTTRPVAVKILHPRFQESVNRDLLFIEIVAEFLNSLPFQHLKMLNLPRAVEEFGIVLRDQADLNIEASNLRQFRTNFYKNSEKTEEESSIIFPQPIDGWTSSKVIVEDYVGDAVPIADFLLDSSQEGMKVRKELAGPLLRAFLKMVFMDNYIHGDLHPYVFPFVFDVFFFSYVSVLPFGMFDK
jgi:aarF domain-containing kinase